MKDEEMAEEIANKRCHEIGCFGHCSFNSPKHHRCGEWHREYNCALEGIKAGRPQWHDLRKDPTDLPKDTVSDLISRGTPRTSRARYNGKWYGYYSDDEIEDVIAWCEIPTFVKE